MTWGTAGNFADAGSSAQRPVGTAGLGFLIGIRRIRFVNGTRTQVDLLAKVRMLMCRPEHYGVTYSINPWMDPASWSHSVDDLAELSRREWGALYRTFVNLGASVDFVAAASGVPDLVFTANAAVVLNRTALLARFRHPERQREEPHFSAVFQALQAQGLLDAVWELPRELVLEGAGDCVWDPTRRLFWMGHGQRSDAASADVVRETFGMEVIPLELADSFFYHMDTALCPLPHGEIMFVPEAFTPHGRAVIHERIAPSLRIQVGAVNARQLAANAVCFGNRIVMSHCGDDLRAALHERGYRVLSRPLRTFRRSGGSASCLTLRLDHSSEPNELLATSALKTLQSAVLDRQCDRPKVQRWSP
jgi:N-dimethylarginine dimethylaminohydrolase